MPSIQRERDATTAAPRTERRTGRHRTESRQFPRITWGSGTGSSWCAPKRGHVRPRRSADRTAVQRRFGRVGFFTSRSTGTLDVGEDLLRATASAVAVGCFSSTYTVHLDATVGHRPLIRACCPSIRVRPHTTGETGFRGVRHRGHGGDIPANVRTSPVREWAPQPPRPNTVDSTVVLWCYPIDCLAANSWALPVPLRQSPCWPPALPRHGPRPPPSRRSSSSAVGCPG
jgi:hypothetical protein